ncbi:Flp family type IVb pilin [Oricola cellulosilytica]|uniref:Flp family type IVb pilin n=1 Tax=Oricola cellulosilytica TaxID=1429082 RepID=UPI001304DCCA|nr:hypothetical protein [Oricola cellulosilytica]
MIPKLSDFFKNDVGVSQVEYLVLLGLMIGGVIVSVSLATAALSQSFGSWAQFFLYLRV